MKAPTAAVARLAWVVTWLMTSGQKREAPAAPMASPQAAATAAGETDSSRIPPAAARPPTTSATRAERRPSSGPPAPRVVAATDWPTT